MTEEASCPGGGGEVLAAGGARRAYTLREDGFTLPLPPPRGLDRWCRGSSRASFRLPSASWLLSWPILAPSWPNVRTILAYLGPSWRHLGSSCPHLGLLWCHLGIFRLILAPSWPNFAPNLKFSSKNRPPDPRKLLIFHWFL